jgi:hypothetical protein
MFACMVPEQGIVCCNITCPKIIILCNQFATFKSEKHNIMRLVRKVLRISNCTHLTVNQNPLKHLNLRNMKTSLFAKIFNVPKNKYRHAFTLSQPKKILFRSVRLSVLSAAWISIHQSEKFINVWVGHTTKTHCKFCTWHMHMQIIWFPLRPSYLNVHLAFN